MAPEDYEKDTREMLSRFEITMRSDFSDFKGEIRADLAHIQTNLTNHLAHRLPAWASVVFAILTMAIGILAGLKL